MIKQINKCGCGSSLFRFFVLDTMIEIFCLDCGAFTFAEVKKDYYKEGFGACFQCGNHIFQVENLENEIIFYCKCGYKITIQKGK